MRIKSEYRDLAGATVWDIVVEYVKSHGSFTSVTGITYSATFVESCIFVKGGTPGTKRAVEGEHLTGKDFVRAYDAIKSWDFINVSQVKPYIKRQQTPFIGLLVSCGIMEEDTKLFD